MKLFLDTAHLENIKQWAHLIDGVTTNLSHLSHGDEDTTKIVLAICNSMKDKEISVEVTQYEPEAVYKQARQLAELADNVVVKIPYHKDYYQIIQRLVKDGVALNITLVFTVIQGLFMAKLGVRYISPFVGRLDDMDVEGIDVMYELRHMLDQYGYESEIIASSLRHIRHFHEVIMAGVDVATLPVNLLEQSLDHPLTSNGMEKFNNDWLKLGAVKFPFK